ncbi:protein LYK5 isoform X2 [Diospyros lotus]|uniref:protein LYK5 isoform X2 n=1 Tax=Diospyros lotus TaxID=55363 RepID=UPI0022529625|nr:protein LYK5 isoform X2 [Diospyros lotus]
MPNNSMQETKFLTATTQTKEAHLQPSFTPVLAKARLAELFSSSGWYYQANTTYVTSTVHETYFIIANQTFQGLSTCDILMRENVYGKLDLGYRGLKLQVPLRCACPSRNQVASGAKFILTYLVTWNDRIPEVSKRFSVSARSVVDANGFSEEDPVLYPFTTILIPIPAEPSSSQSRGKPRNRKSKKGLYIGAGTGVAAALLCFVLFLGFMRRKGNGVRVVSWKVEEEKKKLQLSRDLLLGITKVDRALKLHEFKDLEAATGNFAPQNRLSNSVYWGVLCGEVLAIKKMNTDASGELQILNRINHSNLISLYGACQNNGVFYLIYEFMENGSLKDWLHKECCQELQSCSRRIQIALDVANGLLYLHNFTQPAYIHKDINSSNILLNRDLRAKIANFSLAKSAEQGENQQSSARCALNRKGYVAPEYSEAGLVTPMMDVYAFGVVLLELITGKDAVSEQDGEESLLSDAVLSIAHGGNAVFGNLIDPRLQVKHPLGYTIDRSELAVSVIKLSIACLAQEPESRLNMAEVFRTLTRIQLEDAENFTVS